MHIIQKIYTAMHIFMHLCLLTHMQTESKSVMLRHIHLMQQERIKKRNKSQIAQLWRKLPSVRLRKTSKNMMLNIAV